LRLYNPKGPDRVAVVSAEPAARGEGAYLIRLARGPRAGALVRGGVYGPYPAEALGSRFAGVGAALRGAGVGPPRLGALLGGPGPRPDSAGGGPWRRSARCSTP